MTDTTHGRGISYWGSAHVVAASHPECQRAICGCQHWALHLGVDQRMHGLVEEYDPSQVVLLTDTLSTLCNGTTVPLSGARRLRLLLSQHASRHCGTVCEADGV